METLANTSDASLSPLQVLLIEDNPGDIHLVERHLKKADSRLLSQRFAAPTIRTATSLAEGRDELATSRFDVILLDLGLPDSQGIETLRRLMEHTSSLPIVVLTGMNDQQTAFDAVRQGAEDFLCKDGLDETRLTRSLLFAIERHERRLTTNVIESAKLALLLFEIGESTHRVVFVNQACKELTGYDHQSWTQQGLTILGDDNGEDSPAYLPGRVLETGKRQTIEHHSTRADGSRFWNKVDAVPIVDPDDQMTHILFSFDDISARVKWQAKMSDLDRMGTLGTVAVGVAHEINNPLTFISANVQFALKMLRQKSPDNPIEKRRDVIIDSLEDAMEGSHRVRSVVEDLQQLTGRPDQLDFPVEKMSVVEPLEASLTIARNHIKDRAQLHREFDESVDVMGNRSKLGQVFLNLLINAAHAIPAGNPTEHRVHVCAASHGDEIRVSVSDTGEGISEKNLDRLFEPFFSTKTSEGGTGLGLPISKYIVEQLDGRLEIDTAVGEGTTVTVVLPAAT